jgi:hypothetical protein
VISVQVNAMSEKPKKPSKTFEYVTANFTFQIPEFSGWKIEVTPQGLRYLPQGLQIKFEMPPTTSVISSTTFNKYEHKALQTKLLNPNKVEYSLYFLKGFQSHVLKFESKDTSIYVKIPDDVSDHGLISQDVETLIIQTFKFL